jgi:hypothetical protein
MSMSNHAPICRHRFPDNHRCGSPCLRGQGFCYHHHPDRARVSNTTATRERRGFRITPPTDRRSLQLALGEILVRLGTNKIDPKRAGLMLHTLQIASRDLTR